DEPSVDSRIEVQRRRLQRVADALAWSLEPRAVAAQLIEAACTTLDAPRGWCAVLAEDGTEAVMLASLGYDDAAIEPWSRVPIDADLPMTEVMRTGRAITHASAAERAHDYPDLRERPSGQYAEASAVVPMVFEGTTTGALALAYDQVQAIDASDRWFLEALAAYGAGALERARLFAAVRQRDDRLQLALETSATWIWEWDVAANRVAWNPGTPDFGPAAGSTSPEVWLDTVHPDDRQRVRETLEECARVGGAYEMEFRVGGRDEPERWLLGIGRLLPQAGDQSARLIGTTRDVTERKLAELERNKRLEAERDAARLRDAFIGVVSHELRTPITTIFGGTRVLSRRWREMEPAARDALLNDVSGEADRLFRLVEDLLVLTSVERGSLDVGDDPVALRPIVERVVASERARSPEVAFEAAIPADLPSVRGEEMYVEQVLRNLLANAAKYSGSGARVTVQAKASAAEVVLSVLDEGPGIPEAEGERIFELFYRSPSTAPTASGAGIGLFVCRQLAQAMGGSIHAHNRPQGGAEFELELRRYLSADDAEADEADGGKADDIDVAVGEGQAGA
ncbi:MAG TPA: ATP-binding protein, partial [Candidatus Limnocylindrales bacterium]